MTTLTRLAGRACAVAWGGMLAFAALAWIVLAAMAPAWSVPSLAEAIATPGAAPWGLRQVGAAAAMWTVMMAAMMLPTVSPWVAALSALSRRPARAIGGFLTGYLLVWTAYSVAAALVQWTLHGVGMLSAGSALDSRWPAAALLVAVGLYQWTPVKRACLRHCRSPLGFFLTAWRPGRRGALRMGLRHGGFCVACCWGLMALSFVAGVMNLVWMALVSLFVLADHALIRSEWPGRVAGAGLGLWGLWVIW